MSTLASSVCSSVYAVVSFSFKPILVIVSFTVYYSKENNANDTAKLAKVASLYKQKVTSAYEPSGLASGQSLSRFLQKLGVFLLPPGWHATFIHPARERHCESTVGTLKAGFH